MLLGGWVHARALGSERSADAGGGAHLELSNEGGRHTWGFPLSLHDRWEGSARVWEADGRSSCKGRPTDVYSTDR